MEDQKDLELNTNQGKESADTFYASKELLEYLQKMIQAKNSRTGKHLYPKALICDQGDNVEGGNKDSNEINALGKISQAFEEEWSNFEKELNVYELRHLKNRAFKAAKDLFTELILPHYQKSKKFQTRRSKVRIENLFQQINRDYPSVTKMLYEIFGNNKNYDELSILGGIYVVTFYISIKRYLKVEKKLLGGFIENEKKDIQENLTETLEEKQDSTGEIEINDLYGNILNKEMYQFALKHLFTVGKRSGMEKVFNKLLKHSACVGRVKTLKADVKKAFKAPYNIDKFTQDGTTGDTVGIRFYIYNEKAVEGDIHNFLETIQSDDSLFVEVKHKGLLGKHSTSNIHSTDTIFPYLNIKIYKKNSTGDKDHLLGEIQFQLHEKVMYSRAFEDLLNKGQLSIKNNHRYKTTEISYNNLENFSGYMLQRMNDMQHNVYDIIKDWSIIYKLIPNEILDRRDQSNQNSVQYINGKVREARESMFKQLDKDLSNPEIIRYLKTNIFSKTQYRNILFTGFKKPLHKPIENAIIQGILNTSNKRIRNKQRKTKGNNVYKGKKVEESNISDDKKLGEVLHTITSQNIIASILSKKSRKARKK